MFLAVNAAPSLIVATTLHGAKLNSAPMKAFRAPGFVEGTFGLECLLDELAAKLGLDPLELRRANHADLDVLDGRPFSSKSLMECYHELITKHPTAWVKPSQFARYPFSTTGRQFAECLSRSVSDP